MNWLHFHFHSALIYSWNRRITSVDSEMILLLRKPPAFLRLPVWTAGRGQRGLSPKQQMRERRAAVLGWVTELLSRAESFTQLIWSLIHTVLKWLCRDVHFGGTSAPNFNLPVPVTQSSCHFPSCTLSSVWLIGSLVMGPCYLQGSFPLPEPHSWLTGLTQVLLWMSHSNKIAIFTCLL